METNGVYFTQREFIVLNIIVRVLTKRVFNYVLTCV